MLNPWNRVNHLLDDIHVSLFSPSPSLSFSSNVEGFSPHYPRWRDEGDAASLTLEVPGLSEDQLEVSVQGDRLTLRVSSNEAAPEGYSLVRRERSGGSFKHQLQLKSDWDPESLKAALQDGILTLRVSKATRPTARVIPISVQAKETSDA